MSSSGGVTRRRLLKGAGAVTVIAAGGLVWRAIDQQAFSRSTGPAYEPWTNWRNEAPGTPLALVAAAILGANPHNTQPWLFDVHSDRIDLYADYRRRLGTMDPYLREMHMGVGCALENLVLAAPANGFQAAVTVDTGRLDIDHAAQELDLVARIALTPAAQAPDPLYDQIALRRTNRGPYDPERPIPASFWEGIPPAADGAEAVARLFLFHDGAEREQFDTLTVTATERIVNDSEMLHDSHVWFRNSPEEIARHRDGLTLDAAGMPPLITTVAKMLPPLSAETSHQSWLDATRDIQLPTTPTVGFISVRDRYDKAQTVAAGRLWQRLHLRATAQGIAMQPINQVPEIIDRERQLGIAPSMADSVAALINSDVWQATFGFRAGYPEETAFRSPRRPVSEVTKSAV